MLFQVVLLSLLVGLCSGQGRQPQSDDERVAAVVTEVNDIYYTGLPTTWITRDVDCPRTIRSIRRVQLKPTDIVANVTIKDQNAVDAAEFCQSASECGAGLQCQTTETEEHVFTARVDRMKRSHVKRHYGSQIAFFGPDLDMFEIKITFPAKCECKPPP